MKMVYLTILSSLISIQSSGLASVADSDSTDDAYIAYRTCDGKYGVGACIAYARSIGADVRASQDEASQLLKHLNYSEGILLVEPAIAIQDAKWVPR